MHHKQRNDLNTDPEGSTYPQVIRKSDQHATVVHKAGHLTAIIQLPVPGQKEWCL